jgi:hypothetical protein
MYRLALPFIATLALASCAEGPGDFMSSSPPPPEAATSAGAVFDASDFAWSTATGTGSIDGAFNYHQATTRFSCAGTDVVLTPQTTWSRRRMIILYGSANAAAVPVSIVRARTPTAGTGDYARFVRRSTCDASNHFTFGGLPDGSWFVITVGKPVGAPGEPIAVTRRIETHGGVTVANLS